MTIPQLFRKLGYIKESTLVDVAMEVYDKNCNAKAYEVKELHYSMGNANAVGYILGRFGIDITKEVKNRKQPGLSCSEIPNS